MKIFVTEACNSSDRKLQPEGLSNCQLEYFTRFLFLTPKVKYSGLFSWVMSEISYIFVGFCQISSLRSLNWHKPQPKCKIFLTSPKKKDLNSYNLSGSHTWDLVPFTCRSLRTGEHTRCQVRLGLKRQDSLLIKFLKI